jgi:hypothetical protein
MKRFGGILIALLCFTFTAKSQFADSIQKIIDRDTSLVIREVFSHPQYYRLKIVYTQVYTNSFGNKKLSSWSYRDTVNEYFYPASLVKIPLVLTSMQFFNEHKILDPKLSDILVDSSSYIKERTIYDDIMLMLSASDNFAFNRIYNLVGPKYININLLKKKYLNTIVIHRFQQGSTQFNQTALPVTVLSQTCDTLYSHRADPMYAPIQHGMADSLIGFGYFLNDSLIPKPKSFKYHNFVDIRDVHDMMISLNYPNLTKRTRFNITENQRKTIIKCLQTSPLHPNTVEYSDTAIFYPNYLRFTLFGRDKKITYPNIEYFNKSAMAYGFLGDCCYLKDTANDVEFYLSIYMYVNKDEILNDNKYDYDEIGVPFMKRLGEIIYSSMKKRKE